jgi:hypothetical protein
MATAPEGGAAAPAAPAAGGGAAPKAAGGGSAPKRSPYMYPALFLVSAICLVLAAMFMYPERRSIEWMFDFLQDQIVQFGIVAVILGWIAMRIKKESEKH